LSTIPSKEGERRRRRRRRNEEMGGEGEEGKRRIWNFLL
jgi:hypothetical protein